MAKDDKWMEKAFANSHGQFKKKAGVKKGEKLTMGKAEKMKNEKGASTKTKRQASLAELGMKYGGKKK